MEKVNLSSKLSLLKTKPVQHQIIAALASVVLAVGTILALPLLFTGGTITPAHAVPGKADFNGDGFADLAIGVRLEDVGSVADAGAVNVIYGSSSGLSATAARADQIWTQDSGSIENTAEAGDNFGSSLATGDFNNDGYSDLAIGVPLENLGSVADAGAVNVIYGSSEGLRATAAADTTGRSDQFWTQNSTGIEDISEGGDRFGSSLASGDFNGDDFDDLAIGVYFEDVGSVVDAGAVNVIYGSSSGLSASATLADQFWHQDAGVVEDTAETEDLFGFSLAAGDFNGDGKDDLAIGVRLEDVGSVADAGAVNVIYGSSSGLSETATPADQIWTQNSGAVEDTAEGGDNFGSAAATGDFNNDGFSDLAIGVLFEDVGSVSNAGAVNVIYGSSAGLSAIGLLDGTGDPDQLWTQSTGTILESAELSDQFGFALATGDFNDNGFDDLAIGVFLEDIEPATDAGAVNVIYGSSSGLGDSGNQIWHQGVANIAGTLDLGDQFGSALATGDFNNDGKLDLAIGVPDEDFIDVFDEPISAAGAVNVIYGSSPSGLSATAAEDDQIWQQDAPSVEGTSQSTQLFGSALASG